MNSTGQWMNESLWCMRYVVCFEKSSWIVSLIVWLVLKCSNEERYPFGAILKMFDNF